MSFPQELVDAVIDCIGVPYAQTNAKIGYSNLPVSQSGRDDLQSLALVSRACNHRVRSHLFAHHRVHNSPCSLDQCPDVLLGYARTLTIFECGDPADIIPSIRRFTSSPLVSISLRHLNLPQELPEMLKLSFPNIRRIFVRGSMLNPFVLLNLVSTLERVDQLCLMLCTLDLDIEIDKSPPGLPPLHGCLIVDDPYYSVTVLLSRIPLPLRSLRYASRAHTPEQGFINACAGSLENLQVIMLIDWGEQTVCVIFLPIIHRFDRSPARFYPRSWTVRQPTAHFLRRLLVPWRTLLRAVHLGAPVDPPGSSALEHTVNRGFTTPLHSLGRPAAPSP